MTTDELETISHKHPSDLNAAELGALAEAYLHETDEEASSDEISVGLLASIAYSNLAILKRL